MFAVPKWLFRKSRKKAAAVNNGHPGCGLFSMMVNGLGQLAWWTLFLLPDTRGEPL